MRKKAAAAAEGRKYTQPDKKVEHENMIQTQIDKRVGNIDLQLQGRNLKQADRDKLLAARREIEKDVRRQFPFKPETNMPPPGNKPDLDTFLNAARTLNPGVSDAALTTYYNSKYK